jgi:ABC-type transport system involved in multi-copper enzyme maturation permease subunit
VNGAQTYITLFGQEQKTTFSLKEFIWNIEGGIAAALFSAGVLLALFATSSLIPSMLQKGTIDLFISKPLSRSNILLGRYLGATSIVAFNIFYLVIGSWLVLSIKTGLWNSGFLLAGVMIVVTYMIMYSIMMFFGVLTSSSAFSLMVTFLVIIITPMLIARDRIYALLSSKVYGYLLDGLYYFLPKGGELGDMTQKLVRGVMIENWLPLWTSLLFAVFMFFMTQILFSRKNY